MEFKCLGWNRKGELRKIEGTGVIEDMKNPAKLGISYSYGEKDVWLQLSATFDLYVREITFFWLMGWRENYLLLFLFCSQCFLTPRTGSCPLTTWTPPWSTPAQTSSDSSTSTSPGSWAAHGPCRIRLSRKPERSLQKIILMWAGWLLADSRAVTKLCNRAAWWGCSWQEGEDVRASVPGKSFSFSFSCWRLDVFTQLVLLQQCKCLQYNKTACFSVCYRRSLWNS